MRITTDSRGSKPRWRHLLAALVALALLAGCGPQADGDPQLTVYLSAPLSGPRAEDGQDIADGAELALADAGAEAGGTAVVLKSLDDATADGWDAATTGANARLATQDSTAIAYVGELDSGASRTSLPITNEAGILQMSPGSGAEDLTRDALGSNGIPSVQPSGARTFGRVIPSDRAQGAAAAAWMSDLGITSVTVLGGDTDFGAALTAGLGSASPGPAIVEPGAQPEATLLAFDGQSEVGANASSAPLAAGSMVFGSDALVGSSGSRALGDLTGVCSPRAACARTPLRLTSAALDPTQLPPAADPFLAAFRDAHGHKPGRYAAYGYEAMAAVLDAIDRADEPLERRSVVDALFATDERDSILGTYSIDGVGNTTLPSLGAYAVGDTGDLIPERDPIQLP